MTVPHFLIVADSFKHCLPSIAVGEAIRVGIQRVYKDAQPTIIPMADGGEGTVAAVLAGLNGKKQRVDTVDALNRPIEGFIGLIHDGQTAIIEMAAASGIEKLTARERNPMLTTSYGTGLLIKAALNLNCKQIIIGMGGSATNDGGVGMAQALGVKFYDSKDKELALGGGNLHLLHRIDMSELDKRILNTKIRGASDVVNPLCGSQGASFVYGPQKGATQSMCKVLDKNLYHLALKIKDYLNLDVLTLPGGGAAGGLGAGIVSFLGAKLESGFSVLSELLHLSDAVKQADVLITAEGSFDNQTNFGKTPIGIATLALKFNKPVFVLAGNVAEQVDVDNLPGISAVVPITKRPVNLETAIQNAPLWLADASEMLSRIYNAKV
jgi:glycerate kinase